MDLSSSPALCSCSRDMTDYLQLIITSKVYEVIETTPLTKLGSLSEELQCKVMLKREDMHPVYSYRLRGIYNKMANLDKEERWKGVISGYAVDALAIAYSAKKLRVPSVIVLPLQTKKARVQELTRLGSTVILHGESSEAAKEECSRLQSLYSMTLISQLGDAHAIAGYGTIGMEILKQTIPSQVQAVFCPINCGALIAGLGIYLNRMAPNVKVIGVEINDLADSIHYKEHSPLEERLVYKGMSSKVARICSDVIYDIVQVSINEVLIATKNVYEDTRQLFDTEGALAIAGLKSWVISNGLTGLEKDLIAISSETQIDFLDIPGIVHQAQAAEGEVASKESAATEADLQCSGASSTCADGWSSSTVVFETGTSPSSKSEAGSRP